MLLLKVWRWRPDGTFVAVCILWIRPDDNEIKDEKEGSRLHFRIVAAHEFGTDRMIEQEKNDFLSGQNNNDEDRSCLVINSISFLLYYHARNTHCLSPCSKLIIVLNKFLKIPAIAGHYKCNESTGRGTMWLQPTNYESSIESFKQCRINWRDFAFPYSRRRRRCW